MNNITLPELIKEIDTGLIYERVVGSCLFTTLLAAILIVYKKITNRQILNSTISV